MRTSRFSEERIVGIPKEHEAGTGGAPCRRVGIGEQKGFRRKRRYGL